MTKKNILVIVIIVILLLSIIGIIFVKGRATGNLEEKPKDNQNEIVDDDKESEKISMKLKINETDYEVLLEDNDTVNELLKRLPLNVTMSELNANEKYYYFEDSLPDDPEMVNEIEAGDIMLFGEDCLVIFYESFKTNYAYTRIGKITDSTSLKENLNESGGIVSFVKE